MLSPNEESKLMDDCMSDEQMAEVLSHRVYEPDDEDVQSELVTAAGDVGDNANSLDATADALLTRVAQFFGECVGGDTFCGLGIDEARDENGVLQYLRLVPCDTINGEPVRRVAK